MPHAPATRTARPSLPEVLAGVPRTAEERWRTERMIQRVRAAAILLAIGLSLHVGGGPGGRLWVAVVVLALTLGAVELGLRRPPRIRPLQRIGVVAFCGDTLATVVTLWTIAADPTDPIVTLTLLLGVEAALRWQLGGALLGGALGSALATLWLSRAHDEMFGSPPPVEYLVFRGGSNLLLVVLVGAIVRELDRSRHHAATVLALTPELIVTLDAEDRITSANPAAGTLLGEEPADLLGRRWDELTMDARDGALAHRPAEGLLRSQLRHADGTARCFELSVRDDPGKGRRYLVGRDITARRAAERERSVSAQRYRALFANNPDAVFGFDLDGRIVDVNPAAEVLFRRSRAALLGSDALALIAPDHREQARSALARTLQGTAQEVEVTLSFPDGRVGHADADLLPIVVDGAVVGVFGMARDITERRRREASLEYRATHDPLTGLANRALLHHHLEAAAADHRRHGVLFLDLDGFKAVNDAHGHAAGDEVLVEVARRLQATVRDTDLVSRFAGDEFCVLLPQADQASVHRVGERLYSALAAPFHLDGGSVRIGASIGAALPRPDEDPAALLERADAAMYTVKEHRRLQPAGALDVPLLLAS